MKRWDDDIPVRLRIYDIAPNGKPGEDLLRENVIITPGNIRNGIFSVDVSAYHVNTFGNGVFVGVEFLEQRMAPKRNDKRMPHSLLVMTTAYKQCYTYARTLVDTKYAWHQDIFLMHGETYNMLAAVSYK